MSYLDHEQVDKMFTHHAPKDPETVQAHERVRAQVREVAHVWVDELPEGPEKTLAIRRLQEAMMFANSAIAQSGADI